MNPPARLLVVDDEAPQLQALCEVLRLEGHDVTGCESPQEALGTMESQRFDVLLTDLNMPGVDGIELVRRALEIDADLVAVLMTGQGTIPTAVEAMRVGALDYVLKPFRIAAIRPVLVRAIDVHRLKVSNRRLQEAVTHRSAQLEAANRELDSFAARIAHDLRGPLLAMLGFSRVISEHGADRLDETNRGYLQRVIAAGERAERMVRDLLAFARSGELALRHMSVELDRVVAAARDAVTGEANDRPVEWHVQPLPRVWGDAALLELVFVNLLSNALKYTRTRKTARIEIGSVRQDDGRHAVWVSDNGVGFDPAYAERLFCPFQRLHPADQFEGNGMGLANVKRIVERHGGAVEADSRPNEGATFRIVLPSEPGP